MWDCNTQKKKKKKKVRYLSKTFFGVNFVINIIKSVCPKYTWWACRCHVYVPFVIIQPFWNLLHNKIHIVTVCFLFSC